MDKNAHQDLVRIVEAQPDAIVIPDVESAQDILLVDRLLTWWESDAILEKTITLQAHIGTAKGVQFVDETSRAS